MIFFFRKEKAKDRGSENQVNMSTPTSDMSKTPEIKPQIKIGHYILRDTLGVGTFGKVKGEFLVRLMHPGCMNSVR